MLLLKCVNILSSLTQFGYKTIILSNSQSYFFSEMERDRLLMNQLNSDQDILCGIYNKFEFISCSYFYLWLISCLRIVFQCQRLSFCSKIEERLQFSFKQRDSIYQNSCYFFFNFSLLSFYFQFNFSLIQFLQLDITPQSIAIFYSFLSLMILNLLRLFTFSLYLSLRLSQRFFSLLIQSFMDQVCSFNVMKCYQKLESSCLYLEDWYSSYSSKECICYRYSIYFFSDCSMVDYTFYYNSSLSCWFIQFTYSSLFLSSTSNSQPSLYILLSYSLIDYSKLYPLSLPNSSSSCNSLITLFKLLFQFFTQYIFCQYSYTFANIYLLIFSAQSFLFFNSYSFNFIFFIIYSHYTFDYSNLDDRSVSQIVFQFRFMQRSQYTGISLMLLSIYRRKVKVGKMRQYDLTYSFKTLYLLYIYMIYLSFSYLNQVNFNLI